MSEINERAQNVFRKVFDSPTLVLSDSLSADQVEGWTSMAHIQLIQALQKEFGVKFKASEVVGLKNAGELMARLQTKLTTKA